MIDSVIDALAVFRGTRLVTEDVITEPLRERVYRHFGAPEENKFSYLFTCPHCASVYVALLAALSRHPMIDSVPGVRTLRYAMALSAVTSLIKEREAILDD